MSGLVFVQDAQARPLMPTSAAYARTLLHKRKAQRISHPAFNIIQLTSVVPKPILRPVVLSIFLHHQAAHLTLLTEHLRGTISSLSMIVDLTTYSQDRKRRRIGWRPRGYARNSPTSGEPFVQQALAPYVSMLSVRQQMRLLATLIAALQAIIPISHLSIVTTPRDNPARARMSHHVESWLIRYLTSLSAPINLIRSADLQATLSPELAQSVQRAGAATDKQRPDLITFFLDVPGLQRKHSLAGQKQPTGSIQLGQVCVFQRLGRTRTGFIRAIYRNSLIVRVVASATPNQVHWLKIRVHRHQVRKFWPVSPILILPLARLSTASDLA